MSAEVFFDTNILVYLLSGDTAKAARSEELLAAGGTISVQVLNEFANAASKRRKAPWSVVKDNLAVFKTLLRIEPLTLETHELGMSIAEQHSVSLYDAMIIAAARLAGCKTLYSEDMQDGRAFDRLMIRNPYR